MSAEIQIDVARPGDGPGITRVQQDGWRSYINLEYGITPELVAARHADSDERIRKKEEQILEIGPTLNVWVAREGDEIVGWCVAQKTEGLNKLCSLYILERCRSQGLGTRMLCTALEWLGDETVITLGVVEYNARAKKLYQRFGFRAIGRILHEKPTFDNGIDLPETLMIRHVD